MSQKISTLLRKLNSPKTFIKREYRSKNYSYTLTSNLQIANNKMIKGNVHNWSKMIAYQGVNFHGETWNFNKEGIR